MIKKRIGDLLLDSGIITKEQLTLALEEQKKTKKRLGDIFIDKGIITEQQLIEALEFQLGIPHVHLYKYKLEPSIINLIPERLAMRYKVLPIRKEKNKLMLAMVDPLDYIAIDDIAMSTGFQIEPMIASREELEKGIKRYYGMQESVEAIMEYLPKEEDLTDTLQDADSPIVKIVNNILQNAVIQRASDIHFDPQEDGLKVRYRIDGIIRTEQTLPKNMQAILTARLKIMANLDITEKRLPQDGRIQIEIDYRPIDLRISTLPTINGEKVVLRVLDLAQAQKGINELGLSEDNILNFQKMIQYPYGMILITGPTGSGKTTTLYALLNQLNRDELNIITVEDPVEYQLAEINQVQVNEKTGLTFARGLRAILRQDPNVIMVGEIRDSETAQIAIRAALTGHLVLSTLHTNTAANVITRLSDMGIEKYLISSSLVGIVAQRLVRRVCPRCAINYEATIEEREFLLQAGIKEPLNLKKGTGCGYCNQTGYYGRIAIHEVLLIDEEIKKMIINNEGESMIIKYAKDNNHFQTLLEDGIKKVLMGETTVSEVIDTVFHE